MTVWPSVTWPSPPTATCPLWRTARMVVERVLVKRGFLQMGRGARLQYQGSRAAGKCNVPRREQGDRTATIVRLVGLSQAGRISIMRVWHFRARWSLFGDRRHAADDALALPGSDPRRLA